jgi:hypothetical protein
MSSRAEDVRRVPDFINRIEQSTYTEYPREVAVGGTWIH